MSGQLTLGSPGRRELARLEPRLRDRDIPPSVRFPGGDRRALVRAGEMAVELGFYDATVWERGVLFERYQSELASVASESRRRSARERAVAERRGVLARSEAGL